MKKKLRLSKNLVTKFTLCLVLIVLSTSLQSAGREKTTRIDGRTNIKLNVSNVKNILSNSTRSRGQISIANIKKSKINGNINLNKINIGNVTNILSNSRNSSAKISIGSIQNVIAKDIDIAVNVKNVKNKVNGGSDNHSTINIGSLRNFKTAGRVNVGINIRGEVASNISGGVGSDAILSIGSIGDDEDYDDDDNKNQGRRQSQFKLEVNKRTKLIAGSCNSIESCNSYFKYNGPRSPTGQQSMLKPVSNELNFENKKSPWISIYGDSQGQLKLLRPPRFSAQLPVRLAQIQTRQLYEEMLRRAEFKMAIYNAYVATKYASELLYERQSGIGKIIHRSYALAGAIVSDDKRMRRLFKEGLKDYKRLKKILKKKLSPPLSQSEIQNLKAADKQKLEKLNSVDKFNTEVAAINRMYLKSFTIAVKSQQRYDKLDNDQNGLYGRYAKANESGKPNTAELQKRFGPAISKWDENSRDALYYYRAMEKSYLRAVDLQKQLKMNTKPGAYPNINKLREMTNQLNILRKQMLNANQKLDAIGKQLDS